METSHSEHYFLIEHIPATHIVANAMSRLCLVGDKPVITTNTVVLCMARFNLSSEPVVQCNARKTRQLLPADPLDSLTRCTLHIVSATQVRRAVW
jgi:hypothetical protein